MGGGQQVVGGGEEVLVVTQDVASPKAVLLPLLHTVRRVTWQVVAAGGRRSEGACDRAGRPNTKADCASAVCRTPRCLWVVAPGGCWDGGAACNAGGCSAKGRAAAVPRLLALGHRLVARIHELSDLPW